MKITATVKRPCNICNEDTTCYVLDDGRRLCKDCYDIEREKEFSS